MKSAVIIAIILSLGLVILIALLVIAIVLQLKRSKPKFENWAGTLWCNPNTILNPTVTSDISNYFVEFPNTRIRPFGASHSWSKVVCYPNEDPSVTFIDSKMLSIPLSVDQEKMQITVSAGILIEELNSEIDKFGLALPTQAYLTSATIGGAISTSTHGSGNVKTFSSYCVALDVVQADGSVAHVVKGDPNFNAMVCSIGTIAFIVSVTMQCVKSFNVAHTRTKSTGQDIVLNLPIIRDNDYYMFFWNPYDDKALLYLWNKTTKAKTNNSVLIFRERLFNDKLVGSIMGSALNVIPQSASFITDIVYSLLSTSQEHVDSSSVLLPSLTKASSEFRYVEEEIAIDVKDLPAAMVSIAKFAKDYQRSAGFSIPVGVLFRFVLADEILLSPAFGRDSVYCSIVISTAQSNWKPFFALYEEMMVQNYQGRPHLGKYNTLTLQNMKDLYGSNLMAFLSSKKQVDPTNKFGSQYTDNLLGLQ